MSTYPISNIIILNQNDTQYTTDILIILFRKNIILKEENNRKKSYPPVQCNYCSKVFDRAVTLRMQTHLDKECLGAPDNTKSKQNVNS
ncbi:hypothetical protein C1645_826650 [Glomus cerebriforme]|uniref:Uncharacterized protein n=1 Tax=Glomus cerebriforme TaxID=658196 RepID=A0A397SQF7_9GLOM|nr:hypothetical protein C1645_826650 [Glomus cerebriforme]